jgi:hypothetical protein
MCIGRIFYLKISKVHLWAAKYWTSILACTSTYRRMYIHTYTNAYMYTCIHSCIHTYIHVYIHTCIHTHTHRHTYTIIRYFNKRSSQILADTQQEGHSRSHKHTYTHRLGFNGDIVSSVSKLAEMERARPNQNWLEHELHYENHKIWSLHRRNSQNLDELVAVAARYHHVLDDMDIHQTSILEKMLMTVRELTVR